MRTIKFRAWDSLQGKMIFSEPDIMNFFHKAFMDNVMQFTGLLDKNGKEIYEGDILNQQDGWYRIIEWDEGCGGFIGVAIGKDVYEKYWNNLGERDESAEIIGNIFENPELLPNNPSK